METWETVLVCTTIGLIVVIAIAKVIFVLRFGDDGTPEGRRTITRYNMTNQPSK
ncbi:MAG: hypothetical protein WCJ35_01375 [Planctomycetota bacterium]